MSEQSEVEEISIEEMFHRIPEDFIPDLVKRPASYSSLKHFDVTPLHFLHYLTAPRKSSPQMLLGSVVDCMILTPDDFDSMFYHAPKDAPKKPGVQQTGAKYMQQGTKEYDPVKYADVMERIQWWEKFEKECEGKRFVDDRMLEQAKRMKESCDKSPLAQDLLAQITQTQETIYFTHPETGIRNVVKMDGRGDGLVMDLKTAADPGIDKYSRSAFDLRYDIQCGISLRAMEVEHFSPTYKTKFAHLILESKAPFTVDVRYADDHFKKVGVGEYDRLMQELKFCRDQNLWRTGFEFKRFFDKTGTLSLPGYAFKLVEKYK